MFPDEIAIAMRSHETGSVCVAVLMPHAPVLIPEVGGGREVEARATVGALRRAAATVVDEAPDAVVVISPHSPRRAGRFGIWQGETLAGDMGRFGRPEVTFEFPNATGLAQALVASLEEAGIATWRVPAQPLDHGAGVPLYFLNHAGWSGPTLVVGVNYPGEGGWRKVGEAIRVAARHEHLRLGVVASGDMSHRLQPGAPAGYEPRAREFDQDFVRILRTGRYESLHQLDPELQELAAEDVVDSTLIAAHACNLAADGHEVFSYEGPFGVGYCVARLYQAGEEPHPGQCLPRIARASVEGHFRPGVTPAAIPDHEYLKRPAGVFVTLRTRDGSLRGCRGTITPRCRNLVEETREVARSSAFQDLRFEPVVEDELGDLSYEVSVLNPPEPVPSAAALDPHRYGVIISTPDGRRGLMLPEVEGLNTVEQQLAATCRKANIDRHEPMSLQRFTTSKFTEL